MASFELREMTESDYRPVYGEVDWVERERLQRVERGIGMLTCWFTHEDYEVQMTQETCLIHITGDYQNDPLDAIQVLDTRDDNWWIWWRATTPNWEDMWTTVKHHAKIITTPIPEAEIVDLYEQRELQEIERMSEDFIQLWKNTEGA